MPLAGVAIEAEISSFCARVTVAQRYVNHEKTPIEAVYVFPLDEGAAVCGFEAIIDGTLVVGEVKEREEAFRMYDDAMEQGHGAFLLTTCDDRSDCAGRVAVAPGCCVHRGEGVGILAGMTLSNTEPGRAPLRPACSRKELE